jgi:hypothetical protein
MQFTAFFDMAFCVMDPITFVFIRRIVYEGGNWIELAENTLHWRTLINPVMNLRISKSKAFIDR